MKILVTGGAGYLGSVLIPKLLVRGHRVRVFDIGYFGVDHLRSLGSKIELIRDDIRSLCKDKRFSKELVRGCDCIIHLAAISNDPSAELYPELTMDVNFESTRALAEVARSKKIKFIFSSSCSVYGKAKGEAGEYSPLRPLTVYAASKVKSEKVLKEMSDRSWSAIILRNGTLFGYSSRMRFDLVVNIFSLYSTLYNEIKIFCRGKQWRPFLHVSDCAQAFVYFAEKNRCLYNCYNIANENLKVADVAKVFKKINPRLRISYLKTRNQDNRDYRVSTKRMKKEGFSPKLNIEFGAQQMAEAIASGLIQDPESIYYRNAKWLGELTHIGSKEPKEIVTLMEILSKVHSV